MFTNVSSKGLRFGIPNLYNKDRTVAIWLELMGQVAKSFCLAFV